MSKKKNRQFQADLERRSLLGLCREWESAIWLLDDKNRDLMKRPLFRLADTTRRWGAWDRSRHEISISRKLVLDYPWDSVREVLHHEMAHQLADLIKTDAGETAHGPAFQAACRLLRANPEASGTYRPLKDRYSGKQLSKNDRILIRIRKLMALSESRNSHEAEAAMIKAHALMARYNVNLIKRDRPRNFVSAFVGHPALRHTRDAYHLSTLLVDFYFVQGIWVSAWVVEREKMGRVLEITGTRENIVTAEYVYDFVKNHIGMQWSRYNKKRRLTLHRKTDLATGIIEGFRGRLESRGSADSGKRESREVVKTEDLRLASHIRYRYPHIRTYRSVVSSQDEQVLEDGRQIGRKMVISRGITQSAGGRRYLIEQNE